MRDSYQQFDAAELSRNEFSQYVRCAEIMLRRFLQSHVGPQSGKKEQTFLDYGCGGGHFVEAASRLGLRSVGAEIDMTSVNACRTRGLDVRQITSQLSEILRPGELFDVIWLFHVLEHMTAPGDTTRALLKHLAPHGRIVVGVPDQDSFPSKLKQYLRAVGIRRGEFGFVQPPIHLVGFNQLALRKFGERLGFSSVEVKRSNAIDNDSFPVGDMYWSRLPVQRVVYSLGKFFNSGGHLIAVCQGLERR